MVAGTWFLVLLPLMQALQAFEWTSNLHVPNVFRFPGALRLNETLLSHQSVYESLVFCTGVVLLFSKERARRRGRLDWTRRWGVICSYAVFLLSATQVFFIWALVLVGIAAVFQSMPLKYQPAVTRAFVEVSSRYLRYGAYPSNMSGVVLVAFSAIAMLLACVPLFDALRSTGPNRPQRPDRPKHVAAIVVAPLALFALIHLAHAGRYCLGISRLTPTDVFLLGTYFRPQLLVGPIADYSKGGGMSGSAFTALLMEAVKWCVVLAIAVWLSISQVAAQRVARRQGVAMAPKPAIIRAGRLSVRRG